MNIQNVSTKDPVTTIIFRASPTLGRQANVNIQANDGFNGVHTATITTSVGSQTKTSQTPVFYMVVGPSVFNNYFPRIPPILQFLGADPGDVITMKIVTKVPANGRVVSFHVNFQNAGIAK